MWVFRVNAKILEQVEQYDTHADVSTCAALLGYVLFSSCLNLLWICVGCTANAQKNNNCMFYVFIDDNPELDTVVLKRSCQCPIVMNA